MEEMDDQSSWHLVNFHPVFLDLILFSLSNAFCFFRTHLVKLLSFNDIETEVVVLSDFFFSRSDGLL